MRYQPLGSSGLVVSRVGVGCNMFGTKADAAQVQAIVDVALEEGITFFDTAETYGAGNGESETMLGKALQGRRDEAVIATKFGIPVPGNGPTWQLHGSRGYIRRAVENSLRRLGTDYIDLYQIHMPDNVTPWEETLSTLTDLVHEGKIRYFGCANFFAWELVDAQWAAVTNGLQGFISAQNEYNLYNRVAEVELVPAAERLGMAILPYYPLAYGFLTGKYAAGQPAPEGSRFDDPNLARGLERARFDRIEALQTYADERGISLLDVAIGGLAAQPAVGSVIAGATKPEQVKANAAAGRWEPSADDFAVLDTINKRADKGMSYATFRKRPS